MGIWENYKNYVKGGLNTASSLAMGDIGGAFINGTGATMSLFGIGNSNSASKAAATQYKYNLALQQQAQQWNEYMYKNRYQMQREDLEKAGINALYGLGTAPSITSGTNSVGMPDMVGEQNNKFNQLKEILNFRSNLSAQQAQTKLLNAQSATEFHNTQLKALEVIGKRLEVENLPAKLRKELEEAGSRIIKNMADATESYANANLRGAETASEKLREKPLKRYEEFIEKNPQLGKIIEQLDKTGTSYRAFTNILKSGGTGLRLLLNK